MKPLKRQITGPYAGPICPKCGQGMIGKQNIVLPEAEEKRNIRRYGRDICDDCKLDILDELIKQKLQTIKRI